MDWNYHVIHYQAIDDSNVYLILCETLCLLCVFVVIFSDLDFYHKGHKGIHKDHEDCMWLYFNILIHEN